MKKLIICIILFTTPIFAEEIPEYMKDGEIVVTLKDGSIHTFSTNEYKVVKRGSKKAETTQQFVENKENPKQTNNTLILHAGMGNNGLESSTKGNTTTVTEKRDLVGAVTYCQNKICLTGSTNETVMLGIKFNLK